MSKLLKPYTIDFKSCINTSVSTQPNNKQYTKGKLLNLPNIGYHAAKGERDYMEDTFQILHFIINDKAGVFYGVFDGHGGNDVSLRLIDKKFGLFPYLVEQIKINKNTNMETVIKEAYLKYDKIMYDKKLTAGSTACVILVYDNKLYLINCGDSRALIFSDNKKLTLISNDHKPNKPIERNRIYKAGHYVNPFKIYYNKPKSKPENGDIIVDRHENVDKNPRIYLNNQFMKITDVEYRQITQLNKIADTHRICNSLSVSRGFGDFYLKVDKTQQYMGALAAVSPIPDINMVNLSEFKNCYIYILIASDGFWDVNHVTDNFKNMLKNSVELHGLCKIMVDDTLKKGSMDNITIICDKIFIK